MRKKEGFPESSTEEFPSTLDVVKINGRWAQVFSHVTGKDGSISFYWLDDPKKKPHSVKYINSEIIQYRTMNVGDFQARLSKQEFDNLLYEVGNNKPELKRLIKVFGELNSKSETGL